MVGRIVIDDVRPSTPDRYPAKAVVGESVLVSADIFRDGHDLLMARVRFGGATVPMRDAGNDRWEAVVVPAVLGLHEFVVEAWTDRYATWRQRATTKLAAGQDISVELEEGARLFEGDQPAVAATMRNTRKRVPNRLAAALDPAAAESRAGPDDDGDLTSAPPAPLWVDRERALVGAWYELFPRSEGGLQGTTARLRDIAAMGFDIVYLPPIHPIGTSFRKGRNNSLTATVDDVGSPWAIGSKEGGHLSISSDLGTFTDFEVMVERAKDLGMEMALDYALQCSPDHPWVVEHPEWFHQRADGSIAHAENPPKKYEDIYPLNFWPKQEADRVALWDACREILEFWVAKGVRVFRVDNPHTKPLAFWEWLLAEVRSANPDVVFLAEAFTRPKVMAKLAEIGFSQSYTYFTWRTAKWELEEYLTQLSQGRTADYMRPNFWPNTPDILSGPLRQGSPAAFRQRLVLAATMTPSYGIYSGFELCENAPMSEENEEYFESEKFEIKRRDWSSKRSIAPFVTLVNDIRRRHPALQRLRNIRFHRTTNDRVIAYSKHTDDRSDVVLVIVNLDPDATQECSLGLDLGLLGLPWDAPFDVTDDLTGQKFSWTGAEPYVRLAADQAAHILHLRPR